MMFNTKSQTKYSILFKEKLKKSTFVSTFYRTKSIFLCLIKICCLFSTLYFKVFQTTKNVDCKISNCKIHFMAWFCVWDSFFNKMFLTCFILNWYYYNFDHSMTIWLWGHIYIFFSFSTARKWTFSAVFREVCMREYTLILKIYI
jgi:hypothetical protein